MPRGGDRRLARLPASAHIASPRPQQEHDVQRPRQDAGDRALPPAGAVHRRVQGRRQPQKARYLHCRREAGLARGCPGQLRRQARHVRTRVAHVVKSLKSILCNLVFAVLKIKLEGNPISSKVQPFVLAASTSTGASHSSNALIVRFQQHTYCFTLSQISLKNRRRVLTFHRRSQLHRNPPLSPFEQPHCLVQSQVRTAPHEPR